jgi:hypothetical protein
MCKIQLVADRNPIKEANQYVYLWTLTAVYWENGQICVHSVGEQASSLTLYRQRASVLYKDSVRTAL